MAKENETYKKELRLQQMQSYSQRKRAAESAKGKEEGYRYSNTKRRKAIVKESILAKAKRLAANRARYKSKVNSITERRRMHRDEDNPINNEPIHIGTRGISTTKQQDASPGAKANRLQQEIIRCENVKESIDATQKRRDANGLRYKSKVNSITERSTNRNEDNARIRALRHKRTRATKKQHDASPGAKAKRLQQELIRSTKVTKSTAAFKKAIKKSASFVCTCCHRILFKSNVIPWTAKNYSNVKAAVTREVFKKSSRYILAGQEYICKTCHGAIKRNKIPAQKNEEVKKEVRLQQMQSYSQRERAAETAKEKEEGYRYSNTKRRKAIVKESILAKAKRLAANRARYKSKVNSITERRRMHRDEDNPINNEPIHIGTRGISTTKQQDASPGAKANRLQQEIIRCENVKESIDTTQKRLDANGLRYKSKVNSIKERSTNRNEDNARGRALRHIRTRATKKQHDASPGAKAKRMQQVIRSENVKESIDATQKQLDAHGLRYKSKVNSIKERSTNRNEHNARIRALRHIRTRATKKQHDASPGAKAKRLQQELIRSTKVTKSTAAFKKANKKSASFVCTCCHRILFKSNVIPWTAKNYSKVKAAVTREVFKKSSRYILAGQEYICKTCHGAIKRNKIPAQENEEVKKEVRLQQMQSYSQRKRAAESAKEKEEGYRYSNTKRRKAIVKESILAKAKRLAANRARYKSKVNSITERRRMHRDEDNPINNEPIHIGTRGISTTKQQDASPGAKANRLQQEIIRCENVKESIDATQKRLDAHGLRHKSKVNSIKERSTNRNEDNARGRALRHIRTRATKKQHDASPGAKAKRMQQELIRSTKVTKSTAAFKKAIKKSASFVCTCCHRILFESNVIPWTAKNYSKVKAAVTREVFKKSSRYILAGQEYICKTCHGAIKRNKIPAQENEEVKKEVRLQQMQSYSQRKRAAESAKEKEEGYRYSNTKRRKAIVKESILAKAKRLAANRARYKSKVNSITERSRMDRDEDNPINNEPIHIGTRGISTTKQQDASPGAKANRLQQEIIRCENVKESIDTTQKRLDANGLRYESKVNSIKERSTNRNEDNSRIRALRHIRTRATKKQHDASPGAKAKRLQQELIRSTKVSKSTAAFKKAIKKSASFVCTCCHRILFESNVIPWTAKNYSKVKAAVTREVFKKSSRYILAGQEYICKICHGAIKRNKIPAQENEEVKKEVRLQKMQSYSQRKRTVESTKEKEEGYRYSNTKRRKTVVKESLNSTQKRPDAHGLQYKRKVNSTKERRSMNRNEDNPIIRAIRHIGTRATSTNKQHDASPGAKANRLQQELIRSTKVSKSTAAFKKTIKKSASFVCTCCHRILFESNVIPWTAKNYSKVKAAVKREVFKKSSRYKLAGQEYICKTCHGAIKRNKIPAQAKANGLELDALPPELGDLNELERRLIAQRIVFQKIVSLPRGKQKAIHGCSVNVPTNVSTVCSFLPRLPNDAHVIALKLKRKIKYAGHHMYQHIRTQRVMDSLRWLKANNGLYKDTEINNDWEMQWKEGEDLPLQNKVVSSKTSDQPVTKLSTSKVMSMLPTVLDNTSPASKKGARPPGFINRDMVACYANASLQCLFHLPDVQQFLQSKICYPSFPSLYRLFEQWRSRPDDSELLDAQHIRKHVHRRFEEARQQDAHEFLMDLINTADMTDLFLFDIETRYKCTNNLCNESWAHSSPAYTYFLPCPAADDISFNSLLEFQPHDMPCPKCDLYAITSRQVPVNVRNSLIMLLRPRMLGSQKASTNIKAFNHRSILFDDDEFLATAAIIHQGCTFNSGHYVATTYNDKQHKWNYCDDNSVHERTRFIRNCKDIYVFFLTRSKKTEVQQADTEMVLNDGEAANILYPITNDHIVNTPEEQEAVAVNSAVEDGEGEDSNSVVNIVNDTSRQMKEEKEGHTEISQDVPEEPKVEAVNSPIEDGEEEDSHNKVRGIQYSSCLQPETMDVEKNVFSIAPGEGRYPIPILTDEHFEELAYPDKYPFGRGGIGQNRETRITPKKFFNQRMLDVDGRFARDIDYLFTSQFTVEMKHIADEISICVRQTRGRTCRGRHLTAGLLQNPQHLQDMMRKDEAYRFFKNVRGTPAYWQKCFYDMLALIRQVGIPTWFVTLSAADLKWPEVVQTIARQYGVNYTDEDIANLSYEERSRWLSRNPVTAARHFQFRLDTFVNKFLKGSSNPIGKITDFMYRIEFQARGSPHCHAVIWIEGAPKYEEETDEEVVDFIDQYQTCEIPADDTELRDLVTTVQCHRHTSTCRKKDNVCRFGFGKPPCICTLLSKPLSMYNDSKSKRETVHIILKEILQKVNNTLDKPGMSDKTLKEVLDEADVQEVDYTSALAVSIKGNHVVLKRKPSEMWINSYSPALLRAWGANIDFQFIMDPYACVMYVASYMLKDEKAMGQLLKDAATEADKEDIKTKLRKIGTKFLTHREVSAQAAVYRLLSLPLKRMSRKVIFINTSPEEKRVSLLKPRFKDMDPDEEDIFFTNSLQRYSARPAALENICLAEFMATYEADYGSSKLLESDDYVDNEENENHLPRIILRNELGVMKKRRRDAIIRFRKYNIEKEESEYYRSRLMLYHAWRNEKLDLLRGFPTYKEHHENIEDSVAANEVKYTKGSASSMENAANLLQLNGPPEHTWDNLAPNVQQQQIEDIAEGVTLDRDLTNADISEGAHIDTTKKQPSSLHTVIDSQVNPELMSHDEYLRKMLGLNQRQRQFIAYHRNWCKQVVVALKSGQPVPKYRVFLSGPGGVGKSHVIQLVQHETIRLLKYSGCINPESPVVLLTAFTGTAAYNISGSTLHSTFSLSTTRSRGYQSLGAEKLSMLSRKLESLYLLIIDEVSMVGAETLYTIHRRLQDIKGTLSDGHTFGNISILAVGDLYQLPPVMEQPVFGLPSDACARLYGSLWQTEFQLTELVQIMRQKDDQSFAELLNRVRTATLTQEDIDVLKSRETSLDKAPLAVLHVFSTNADVDNHNSNMLESMGQNITDIVAVDTKPKQNGPTSFQLPVKRSETGGLPGRLRICNGAKVVLTTNMDVSDGLVNGARGTVRAIIKEGCTVTHIMVKFDNELVGQKAIKTSNYREYPTAVPIQRTEVAFGVGRSKALEIRRRQFPLCLAWACTIHKCQGATVEAIVVSMRGRYNPGQAYVAFSRVKSIAGLHILNFTPGKIKACNKAQAEMTRLRIHSTLTDTLSSVPTSFIGSSIVIAHLNMQSYTPHAKNLQQEDILQNIDVICLTETFLKPGQNVDMPASHTNILRRDRTSAEARRGGGIMILGNNRVSLQERQIPHNALEGIECMVTVVEPSMSTPILVVTVYKRPCTTEGTLCLQMTKVLDMLPQMTTVILGDFNEDLINEKKVTFLNMMRQRSFMQCIEKPTTDGGSLLDHVYCNRPGLLNTSIVDCYWSYHDMVILSIPVVQCVPELAEE